MLGGRRKGRKQRTIDLGKAKGEAFKAAASPKKVRLPILGKHYPTAQQTVSDSPEQASIVNTIGLASRMDDCAKIEQVRGVFGHGDSVERKKPAFL